MRNQDLVLAEQLAGITFPGSVDFIKQEWLHNYAMAVDAQPQLITQQNSGIPGFLTTFIDPVILTILTAKNEAANILGEVRKGSFVDVTAIFPTVEHDGEVSSYGDYSEDGTSDANTNFPQRQSYLYQTITQWGELQLERAALARINWANEVRVSAITLLNKFQNLSYFYGVQGIQNYGLLNDPNLPAPISPSPKAAGGMTWWNGNSVNATANEIYADIQMLFKQLVSQSNGNITLKSELTLAMSPVSETALLTTNSFSVNVADLLKKNFPNLTVKTAIQYGVLTASNPQGSAGGEFVQMIAKSVEGQETGFCAFNEKMRAGVVIRGTSSFKQKMAQGTFGAVIRQPFAIASMIGV